MMHSSILIELMVIIVTAAILLMDDVFETILKLGKDIYTSDFCTAMKKALTKVTKLYYTKPQTKTWKLEKFKLIIVQTQIVLRLLAIIVVLGRDESL